MLYNQTMRIKIDDYYHRKLNSSKENSLPIDNPHSVINSSSVTTKFSGKKHNFGTFKQFTKRIISTLASFTSTPTTTATITTTTTIINNTTNTNNNTTKKNDNNKFVINKVQDNIDNQGDLIAKLENEESSSPPVAIKRTLKHLEIKHHRALFDKALKITKVDHVFNNGVNNHPQMLCMTDNDDNNTNNCAIPNNLSDNNSKSILNASDSTLGLGYVVQYITIGRYHFETWYKSFYPQERISHDGGIHICDRCLIGLRPGSFHHEHYRKCPLYRPPGKVVKRQGNRTIYEIDGASGAADYCRNLCLIAMFFISGKVAYHEVDHFIFYVLTETTTYYSSSNNNDNVNGNSRRSYHSEEELVGYFSRDKDLELNHTMSCLFILPPHMKRGHGSYLIDYSYNVAKSLGVIGSPEKPLSATGLIAFRSYWCRVLNDYFKNHRSHSKISIKNISMELSIAEIDIITTLQYLGKIKKVDDNYFIIK